MANTTTDYLNLNIWGASDNTGLFKDWRLLLAGDGSDSNMVILDAWANEVASVIQNKQSIITASGLLKGDGSGGISAAIAGTDYAAIDHNHNALYDTKSAVDAKIATALETPTPIIHFEIPDDVSRPYIEHDFLNKCVLVDASSKNTLFLPDDALDPTISTGFECEIVLEKGNELWLVWGAPTDVYFVGTWGTSGYINHQLIEPIIFPYIPNQYGVAIVKKIASNTWLVGGQVNAGGYPS